MANREKGEVSITVNGKTYTLVLTTNAMVQLEDLFSTPQKEMVFQDVLQRVAGGSVRHIRAFVWAALQEHHPAMTVEEAGQLITDAGGLITFSDQLEALTASTSPDTEDVEALTAGSRPQKAQTKRVARGTGAKPTAMHAASA